MPGALAFASLFIEHLPALIRIGTGLIEAVEETSAALKAMQAENRDPSPAEWDALNARIAALRGELHRPA